MRRNKWIDMIIELQSLAQDGLTSGRDDFDLERYARICDIAAEVDSDIAVADITGEYHALSDGSKSDELI